MHLVKKCEWFDVHNLPKEIAFDHREIIEKGMEFLRKNLDYKIYGVICYQKNYHEGTAKFI
jgi:hypothetical protein